MNWRFTISGGHTHVRVFMNGAKCGDLCFRNEEFKRIQEALVGHSIITFIDASETE